MVSVVEVLVIIQCSALYDGSGKPLHAGQSLEVEKDVEEDDKGPAVL